MKNMIQYISRGKSYFNKMFIYRILCDTVKDFATYIMENINSEDQHVEEKCKILQQKLDLFLEILCKEGYLNENLDDADNITLTTEISVSPDICEKGVLEKPEKDITNLKKVQKKRQLIEKETVMSRCVKHTYI